jgi:TolB protein
MTVGDTVPVNLTNHPSLDFLPDWSPDGRGVAFVSNRDHKDREVYVMGMDGGDVRRLTFNESFEESPAWSPDGKRLAFTRILSEQGDTGIVSNGELFLIDPDGKNEVRLTRKEGYDSGAAWSPDGSMIAFYGKRDTTWDIFIIDADGRNLRNITHDAIEDYSPSWSPDGAWIAFTSGTRANYDVWIVRPDGSQRTRLTTQPKRDESPVWRPRKEARR